MQLTPAELWATMGLIAKGVVITLIILSIWSLAVGVERFIYYSIVKKQSKELAPKLARLLKEEKVDEAITLSTRSKFRRSHLGKVVSAGLQEYQHQSELGVSIEARIEASQRAIERATVKVNKELKRGLNALATIASTSPFIGLFGTVFGIINAFHSMAITGAGGIGTVAAGIAEALVTTGTGIFVAVPAVWFYNFYLSQVDILTAEMANAGSEIIDYFSREMKEA